MNTRRFGILPLVGVGALALALAACGGPAPSIETAPTTAASETTSAPVTTPPAAVAAAIEAFEQTAEESGTVGAFILIRTPEGEFQAAYGSTALGEDTPPTADTMFRAGSVSKTFTGTLILQLVEEGLIALDDPVADHLDGVPRGEEITLAMLLKMRSGLADYTEVDAFWDELAFQEGPIDQWEMLAYGLDQGLLFEPGAEWRYSNTNTILLGMIAEQVTGQSLAELVAERIAAPLDLTRTWFPEETDVSLAAPASHGYTFFDELTEIPDDITDFNPSLTGAAGAVVTTASDLADFAAALVGGQLLGAEMHQARMDSLEPITDETGPRAPAYGLGIARLSGLVGHNGMVPGFNTYMGSDPELGITVVLWLNLAPAADGNLYADTMAGRVVPLLLGEGTGS